MTVNCILLSVTVVCLPSILTVVQVNIKDTEKGNKALNKLLTWLHLDFSTNMFRVKKRFVQDFFRRI